MAKQFFTNGTGSQQTLTPSQNEKVAIYDTIADAEADLANLEAGQIVATPDTGDELAQPVDTVTSGDMHSVTSNAVATAITGNTPYNPFFNNYDSDFNIDTVGAGHKTYVRPPIGNTTGTCPSDYGVVETIIGNDGGWKFQVAKETYSDTTYTRQNINDGGWTAWQPTLSGTWETLWSSGNSIIKGIVCNGKAFVTIHLQSFVCSSDFHLITTIAEKYRPRTVSRGYCFSDETPITMGFINIESSGNIYINTMNGKTVYGDSFIMIEKDV